MGVYKFEDAAKSATAEKYPADLCKDCSNIIGAVRVFGNDPHKHKGKGIKLKPQWGGKHATLSLYYEIRSHTDPEHAKKFVESTKYLCINLCELGEQLPFVHIYRPTFDKETQKQLDATGHPRMLNVDGNTFCKHCRKAKTYFAMADSSWVSPEESCTNPECVLNGGEIDIWTQYITDKVICGECARKMIDKKCVNEKCGSNK